MTAWTCSACGLPHALKPGAEPRCFSCGGELERGEQPVDPAAARTLEVLRPSRN